VAHIGGSRRAHLFGGSKDREAVIRRGDLPMNILGHRVGEKRDPQRTLLSNEEADQQGQGDQDNWGK